MKDRVKEMFEHILNGHIAEFGEQEGIKYTAEKLKNIALESKKRVLKKIDEKKAVMN